MRVTQFLSQFLSKVFAMPWALVVKYIISINLAVSAWSYHGVGFHAIKYYVCKEMISHYWLYVFVMYVYGKMS